MADNASTPVRVLRERNVQLGVAPAPPNWLICSPNPFARAKHAITPFPQLDSWLTAKSNDDDNDDEDDACEVTPFAAAVGDGPFYSERHVTACDEEPGMLHPSLNWSIDDLAQLVRS
jgi:hypothetical protein